MFLLVSKTKSFVSMFLCSSMAENMIDNVLFISMLKKTKYMIEFQ